MAIQLPKVTRKQLLEREEEWFRGSAVMSRSLGSNANVGGGAGFAGGGADGGVLQPVKYMLEQTCITLSKAEAKLGSSGEFGAASRLPAIKGAPDWRSYEDPAAQSYGSAAYAASYGSGASAGYQPQSAPGSDLMALSYGGSPGMLASASTRNLPVDAQQREYETRSRPSTGPGAYGGGGFEKPHSAGADGRPQHSNSVDALLAKETKKVNFHVGDFARKQDLAGLQMVNENGTKRVSLAATADQRARVNQDNVSMITKTIESIHGEMHEFDDVIFFIEHSALTKVLIKVLMERAKTMVTKAWRLWTGAGNADFEVSAEATLKKLRPAVAEARARVDAAEVQLEETMARLVSVKLNAGDVKKKAFLVGVFGKNGPGAKRAAFHHWLATAHGLTGQIKLWGWFFKKVANLKLSAAWRQWVAKVAAFKLPPEEQIAALRLEVAAAREEMGVHESALEQILGALAMAAFDGLSGEKKSFLKRVMTTMFNRMQKYALKVWHTKTTEYERYRVLQIGMLNRMCKAFLNAGWITWEYHLKHAKEKERDARNAKTSKTIAVLQQQVQQLNAVLGDQLSEVQSMREAVQNQAAFSARVAEGRLKVQKGLASALQLCAFDEEDPTPPTSSLPRTTSS